MFFTLVASSCFFSSDDLSFEVFTPSPVALFPALPFLLLPATLGVDGADADAAADVDLLFLLSLRFFSFFNRLAFAARSLAAFLEIRFLSALISAIRSKESNVTH